MGWNEQITWKQFYKTDIKNTENKNSPYLAFFNVKFITTKKIYSPDGFTTNYMTYLRNNIVWEDQIIHTELKFLSSGFLEGLQRIHEPSDIADKIVVFWGNGL